MSKSPDIWRVYLDEELQDVTAADPDWRTFVSAGLHREHVDARVDHYPNRFLVTFLRTGYVVAAGQWLPEFKNGRGTWEVYGPDVEPQLHHSTSDAVGAAYGFMLEFLEKG